MQKVIVSVINDLVTDQRVNKVCNTISEQGFLVLLVGRKLKTSLPMDKRTYATHRMKLLFTKGFLFYAEYNIRLFFFLLFQKADVYHANDLDTLLPNFLVCKFKRKELVYDSHEYFCFVPELVNRKMVQKTWLKIEQWIFPKLKYVFTVNESIAQAYEKHYGIKPVVLRNVPSLKNFENIPFRSRSQLSLPENKAIILLQGAGININRGAEEALQAMLYIEDALLLIIGGGDVIDKLKGITAKFNLQEKVVFKNKMPFTELIQHTRCADVGITLDKADNPNYELSLPNKLFDYIHSQIPVLSSPLIEIKKIYSRYNVGELIDNHNPEHIADKLRFMIQNEQMQLVWRQNTLLASREYNWENESIKLKEIYNKFK
ncbi:MAG: glycosyltransferase [Bacteroidetes bacterium]|nr:glycosyltransferase [Bacteroidota bacterium]HET6243014.1 glycosyltransferase [Bacteroidia bacterium]